MQVRDCRPLALAGRAARIALAALAVLTWAPSLHAQQAVTAVPEFIELSAADLQTPTGAALADAQATFRDSLGDNPGRALEAAKSLVSLAVETWGASHDNVSRALTNLAIVQADNAEFSAAIENYTAAIEAREQSSGTLVSGELINPLLGLASAYMALDRVDLAIPAYERAIHISNVRYGPNNLEQVGSIDALSQAYFFSGDMDAADELQDTIFLLRARKSDDNPDLYLDALEQRADWHARLENTVEAARYYRRLVREMSDQYGEDDIRLIEPLTRLAYVVVQDPREGFERMEGQRIASAWGRRAIGRAVKLARANTDESPELLARTLVEEGDYYSAQGLEREAYSPYRQAWNLLDADPALHATRDDLFAAPVRVWRPLMRAVYRVPAEDPANPERYPDEGYVDAVFDVDEDGMPEYVRIVDASPAGLMDAHVRHRVARFRFRPAFEDGRPRPHKGLSYRHTFRYRASALTDRERDIIATTTYETEAASANSEAAKTP